MAAYTEFRIDGGSTWLNLLATTGRTFGRSPIERLSRPDDVVAWCELMGLSVAGPVRELERLRITALRESLRELAFAAVEQRDAAAKDRTLVAKCASLSREGLGVPGALISFDAALAAIAVDALLMVGGPDAGSLTQCAESDCRWVFLDPSGRRRWCPAPACASRGRVRAHRAAATP